MGVLTLVNPNTGQKVEVSTDKVPFTNNYAGKGDAQQYLSQGFVPQSDIDANELGGMGLGGSVPMNANGTPQTAVVGGVNTGELNAAKMGADKIFEDYREYGENNPYMQEYGENNPYLDAAMKNIQELEAMSKDTGTSKYASALLDKQNQIKQMQGEDMLRGYNSDMASAYSNLAQQGGLDGGMRERLASSGNRNLMESRQRLGSQDALARSGILADDMGFKQNLATQIPGMYNPYAMGKEQWQQNQQAGYENWANKKNDQYYTTVGNMYQGGK